MSKTEDTQAIVSELSRREKWAARKGMNDSLKENVIGPHIQLRKVRGNRLAGTMRHLSQHGEGYANREEFVEHIQDFYESDDYGETFSGLTTLWGYYERAPSYVKMFVEGRLTEGGLKYAGGDVAQTKIKVEKSNGGKSKKVSIPVTLETEGGEQVSRAAYLESILEKAEAYYAKLQEQEKPRMLDRKDLESMVDARAADLAKKQDVFVIGIAQNARELAQKAWKSFVSKDAQTTALSGDAADEYKKLLQKASAVVEYDALPKDDVARMRKDARNAEDLVTSWDWLSQLADGVYPRDMPDDALQNLAQLIARAQKTAMAALSGEIVPGRALAKRN